MSKEGFCQHCGHAHPSSRGEGVVKCLHCGLPLDLTDKVQCPGCGNLSKRGTQFCAECGSALFKMCTGCTKRGPVDATFCAECGSALLDYQTYLARKKSEQEELDQQARQATSRRALASVLIIAALLAGAWFFCISPFIGWVGQTGDGSVIRAVQLSQAQIQATQQAEIAQRTQAFEDIEVRVGEIADFGKSERLPYLGGLSYQENVFFTITVIVENKGSVPHEVLISYAPTGEEESYLNLKVSPHSQTSFDVEVAGFAQTPIPSYHDVFVDDDLNVRLESVDNTTREQTSWGDKSWDFEFGLAGVDDYNRYLPMSK